MTALKIPEDQPIQNKLISNAIEKAQARIEGYNLDTRHHLLEYDDVMNKQREVIYKMRDEILKGENLKEKARQFFEETIEDIILRNSDPKINPEEWDWETIKGEFNMIFLTDTVIPKEKIPKMKQEELLDVFFEKAKQKLSWREQELGEEIFNELLKFVLLGTIDGKWRDHLYALDALREGIRLRAYGQKDPLIEYKQESFKMYDELLVDIAKSASGLIFRAQPGPRQRRTQRTQEYKPSAAAKPGAAPAKQTVVASQKKIGRNEPCPCGSGKKYKKCCGRNVQ